MTHMQLLKLIDVFVPGLRPSSDCRGFLPKLAGWDTWIPPPPEADRNHPQTFIAVPCGEPLNVSVLKN